MTDKMAAASDDCNYAAYIYLEDDLSHSLSLSGVLKGHRQSATYRKLREEMYSLVCL